MCALVNPKPERVDTDRAKKSYNLRGISQFSEFKKSQEITETKRSFKK